MKSCAYEFRFDEGNCSCCHFDGKIQEDRHLDFVAEKLRYILSLNQTYYTQMSVRAALMIKHGLA